MPVSTAAASGNGVDVPEFLRGAVLLGGANAEPEPEPETHVPKSTEPESESVKLPESDLMATPTYPSHAAAPVEPVQPANKPMPQPPEFKGSEDQVVWRSFIMTIGFSAIGQILALGPFLSIALANLLPHAWATGAGWSMALFIGAALEFAMVVFCDLGLENRDGRSKAWLAPFGIGVLVACVTVSVNVGHWWEAGPSFALMFGAVGAVGFAAHATHGLLKSGRWIAARAATEQENQARQARYEQDLAEYRAELERERQRQYDLEMERARGKTAATKASAQAANTSAPTLQAVGSNRKPRQTRVKSSGNKPKGRTTSSEYLERARSEFVDWPDSDISVGKVATALDCSKSTASPIVQALKAERGIES